MKTYLLLLLAVTLLWILLPTLYIYQTIVGNFNHNHFSYNLAKNIDYVGGTLFFNSDGVTISAMVWEKEIHWAINLINWMFQDKTHCLHAWMDEMHGKENG